MASPATAPPPEPRAPRATRLLLAVAVALPLAVLAAMLSRDGWLSDTHGAFLWRVHFAVERGRLELLGFEYPPLPFMLLAPWASVAATWLLGSIAVAALAWLVVDECTDRRSVLPLLILVAALWTPIGMHLVVGNFNEAVGLLTLFIGWRHYRRWWETRQTVHGLLTGIWLGIAFYTSPLGLALALVAGAILPLVFPRLQIPPFASQLVLLVFPGLAAAITWAYLSWVFTGDVAFPFSAWEPGSPTLAHMMLWSAPYLVVALLLLLRPSATTAGLLLPMLLLWSANQLGWHYSLGFAVVMLALVAIIALPRDLDRSARALVGAVAVAQAVVAWVVIPAPRLDEADVAARTVAEALADAPPRSILIDDRQAGSLLKWTTSMESYLTTRDTGFELAVAQPLNTVRYVLVTGEGDLASLDSERRPPRGFIRTWSWEGYTLWRHPDAPVPQLHVDALLRMGVE
ncbi:MAG TPA: hypothetical protein PLL69_04455 [Gemmatimonadales bacterium]|nr:hypothetical protein [Gemmatimonadales bacterium]